MAQSSGPISQGTNAERQMTDVLWRNLFGDEAGVIGDTDGTAYNITLPTGSDVATIGSATITSLAKVAGFSHAIPAASPEGITIPAASGATRTDIIALRHDPAYTGALGPVRLVRIAGTTVATPTYDDAPPGIEDLPLWTVTRAVGQALSQATVKRIFPRLAPTLTIEAGASLPTNSPLGTVLLQNGIQFWRVLDSNSVPVWLRQRQATGYLAWVAPSGYLGTANQVFSLGATGSVTLTSTRTVKVTLSTSLYAPNVAQSPTLYASVFAGAARTVVTQRKLSVGPGSGRSELVPVEMSNIINLTAGTYTFRAEGSSNVATGSSPAQAGVAILDPVSTHSLIVEDLGPA